HSETRTVGWRWVCYVTACEGTARRAQGAAVDEDGHGHRRLTAALEQPFQRELHVLEVRERQVEPDREPAEHEMRDALELLLDRKREHDLVGHHALRPASRSSSLSSASR